MSAEENYQKHLYETGNPLVNYLVKLRLNGILRRIGEQDTLLDAGCGEGYTTSKFAKRCRKVTGVEIVPERVDKAKRVAKEFGVFKKTIFLCSDLFELDARVKEKFDVVVCSEVIEHVEKPKLLLEVLKRRLKNNGKLIITYPNETILQIGRKIMFYGNAKKMERKTDHKISLSEKVFREMAEETGFKVTDYQKIPSLPLIYFNELFVLKLKGSD